MYKIKDNAIDLYVNFCRDNEIAPKQKVYQFLETNLGQPVIVHSSGNMVEVSRYEKTEKVPIPFDCIKQIEEVIKGDIDEYEEGSNKKLFFKILAGGLALIILLNILFYFNLPEKSIARKLKQINNSIQTEQVIMDKEIVKLNGLLDNKASLEKEIVNSKKLLLKSKLKIEDLMKEKLVYKK